MEKNQAMRIFRKTCLALLFTWLCIAVILTVFGKEIFFPLDFTVDKAQEIYRFKTTRFAGGCLLTFAVFRYLCSFKALPSLGIVFYYGIFYLIGGCIIGYREILEENIGIENMYHLLLVAALVMLISAEIRQKTKEEGGRFKRDHF